MAEKTFSPVRVRAATQEAAIIQALQMTGAAREEVDVEVVEETEKGVTVRVAPLGTLSAREASAAPAAPAQSAPAQPTAQEEPPAPSPEPEVEVEEDADYDADFDADEEEEEIASDEEDEEEEVAPAAEVSQVPEVREADAEVVEHARSLAQEMLDHMGLEAEVLAGDLPVWCLPTSHDKSERVRDVPRAFLSIEGEDVGILIGKHGQTLQSFQYLLNLSLNNTSEDEEATADGVRAGGVHVVVDAGEYRGRRAVALERAAREAAERAKREQRSIRMEPMPGHERRLVHLALFEDAGVTTSSDGREPWRRVVVTPAGVRPSRGNDDRGGGKRYRGRSERTERSSSQGDGQRSYGSRAGKTGNGRRGYN